MAKDQNLPPVTQQATPKQLQDLLQKGDMRQRQGNVTAAESIFRKLMALKPDHSVASLKLFKILLSSERWAEAEAVLRALPPMVPERLQVLLWLGDLRLRLGDSGEAEALFRKALELQPGHSGASLRLAKVLIGTEQWAEAETVLRTLPDTVAEHLQALLWLGDVRQRQGDADEAEAIFRKVATLRPDHSSASLRLAKILISTEQFQEAEAVLRTLPDTAADNLQILLWLGDVLQRQGRMQEAEDIFRQITSKRPDHAGAVSRLAKMLATTGRVNAGRALLEDFLSSWPNNIDVMVTLGQLLAAAKQDGAAIPLFERVIAESSSSMSAWLGLVRSSARHVSVSAALDLLHVARQRIAHPQLDIELTSLYLRAGRLDEAEQAAASAVSSFPDHVPIETMVIRLHIMAGRFEDAEAGIDRLPKATAQEMLDSHRLMAALEKARWCLGESIRIYQMIIASPRSGPQDHRAVAEALMLRMDVVGARQELQRANMLQSTRLLADGRSMNVSQGLPGEVLNDFCTDPGAVAAALVAQTVASREAWVRAVKDYPHHTGCAIGLFIHLRQAGNLVTKRATSSAKKIPHLVHQFWDTAHVPDDVLELMESWQILNPGWVCTVYSLSSATAFLETNFHRKISLAFRMAESIAGKTDLFRLAALFHFGGVYADADDRCIAPLDPILLGRSLLLRQEHFGSIGNNFMAVCPNHPVIEQALDQVTDALLRGDRESIWLLSGPGLLTRAVGQFLTISDERMQLLGDEIVIAEDYELRRFCASGCHASYKHTERNWQHVEFDRARNAVDTLASQHGVMCT